MKIILVDTRARFRDDVRNRLLIDDERTVELLTDLGSVNGLETAVNRYKPDAVVIADNVYSSDTVVDIYGVATVGYITKPVNPDVFSPNGIATFGFIENATHLLNLLEVGLPAPKEAAPKKQPEPEQKANDLYGMPTYQPNHDQFAGSQQEQPNRPISNNQSADSDPYFGRQPQTPREQPQYPQAPQYDRPQYSQQQPNQTPNQYGAPQYNPNPGQYSHPQYTSYGQQSNAQPQKPQYNPNPYGQPPQYGQPLYGQTAPRQPGYSNQTQNNDSAPPSYRDGQQGMPNYGAQAQERPTAPAFPQQNNQTPRYENGAQAPVYGQPQSDVKSQMDADRSYRTAASGEKSMMADLVNKSAKTKTVAVYAAKGGVGKTTIATELSVLLSLMTQGRGTMRVCLIDFNIDFGDVLTTLNLDIKGPCLTHWAREIRRRVNNGENLDDIKYSARDIEGHLQRYKNSSLYVLVAPIAHEDSMEIESSDLEVIMRNIRENGQFDYVICDTGNNTRDSTVIALEAAEHVLLVATQDVSAVNCDNRFIKTMKRIGFDTNKIALVINSIMPYKYTQVSTKEVEDRFPYPCIARFKRDPEVTKANNCSTPLVEQPNHEFTKEMRRIVAYITGRPMAEPEKKSGFFSKFKKKG